MEAEFKSNVSLFGLPPWMVSGLTGSFSVIAKMEISDMFVWHIMLGLLFAALYSNSNYLMHNKLLTSLAIAELAHTLISSLSINSTEKSW